MALAVTLRFDFEDDPGGKSFTKIRVPNGFTITDYIQFGQAFAQLLVDLSLAQMTSASLTFAIDLSGLGLKAAATGLADVAQKALFIFNTAVAGIRARLRIPTIDEAQVISGGSDAVNTADPDVSAFLSAMTDGIVVAGPLTVQPTNDRAHDITSLSTARESIRRTLT